MSKADFIGKKFYDIELNKEFVIEDVIITSIYNEHFYLCRDASYESNNYVIRNADYLYWALNDIEMDV
nr:MAG TPA: hypothetical protein [Caudoviricetes sp.]